MKVRCRFKAVTDEIAALHGGSLLGRPSFQITLDKSYVVLSITPMSKNSFYGSCSMLAIIDDVGRLSYVPMYLFEIEDSRPSQHWKAFDEAGFISFSHPYLAEKYFSDDLSEDVAEVVAKWESVKSLFNLED